MNAPRVSGVVRRLPVRSFNRSSPASLSGVKLGFRSRNQEWTVTTFTTNHHRRRAANFLASANRSKVGAQIKRRQSMGLVLSLAHNAVRYRLSTLLAWLNSSAPGTA
jgi:hypothetical protein